jgi:PilZ domain
MKAAVKPHERRRSSRRLIERMAKIQLGAGALPRDCLITDISTGGVRLHVEGFDVPTDFVLFLFGENLAQKRDYQECNYQVVWRLGHEIGARFVGLVRRTGAAARA